MEPVAVQPTVVELLLAVLVLMYGAYRGVPMLRRCAVRRTDAACPCSELPAVL